MNEIRIMAVDGGETELQRFVDFVKSDDVSFSFSKIIPLPSELEGTRSPTKIVSQAEYDDWDDENTPIGIGKPITQEMSDKLTKEYGYDNWYDWTIDKWGTKWNSYNCEIVEHEDDYVVYTFDTAWGPPTGVIEALREQCPDFSISAFYDEPGMEIAGYY